MTYFFQFLFIALLASMSYLIAMRFKGIIATIRLSQPVYLSDQPVERWKRVFLLAFGQKKMFQKPFVGLMHFLIYIGFILINAEILEIILDGILGTHRLFAPFLGSLYPLLLNFFELLAAGVFLACLVFFARRGIFKVQRLQSENHSELKGFPIRDAYTILIVECVLMAALWTMNAADAVLQSRGVEHYHEVGSFIVSRNLIPFLNAYSTDALFLVERIAWWFHIAGILGFALYVTYSKHLHIILAFPNTYYAPLTPKGMMHNMPEVQNEVLYAMQPELAPTGAAAPASFGAKDVMDLSSKNLMDAYSCTECGRCTAACPANITGKLLSPRKIMMATRDRLEEVGKNIDLHENFVPDNKSLLHDYITVEELRACTTCNACVEECPISISPLDIIMELRRSLVMEESNAPQEWNSMFSNIENNFAPWKFAPDDRDAWTKQA